LSSLQSQRLRLFFISARRGGARRKRIKLPKAVEDRSQKLGARMQLLVHKQFRSTSRPVVCWLARPGGVFFKSFMAAKRRKKIKIPYNNFHDSSIAAKGAESLENTSSKFIEGEIRFWMLDFGCWIEEILCRKKAQKTQKTIGLVESSTFFLLLWSRIMDVVRDLKANCLRADHQYKPPMTMAGKPGEARLPWFSAEKSAALRRIKDIFFSISQHGQAGFPPPAWSLFNF